MSNEFNANLDKITENEVVPTFLERLKFGSDFRHSFTHPNSTDLIDDHNYTPIYEIDEYKLIDYLRNLIEIIPVDEYTKSNLQDIHTTIINKEDIQSSINRDIYHLLSILVKKSTQNRTLYRAIEISTSSDITDLFELIEITDQDTTEQRQVKIERISPYIPSSYAQNDPIYYKLYVLKTDIPIIDTKGILLFWKDIDNSYDLE